MITENRPLCVMLPTHAEKYDRLFPDTFDVPRVETYYDDDKVGDLIECCRATWFKNVPLEDCPSYANADWHKTEVQCLEVAMCYVRAGEYPTNSYYGPFCEFHKPIVRYL